MRKDILFIASLVGFAACTEQAAEPASPDASAKRAKEPAATPPTKTSPAPIVWEDATTDERKKYMKEVVLPAMKKLFVAQDPEHAEFDCGVCHGPGFKDGEFEMPNPLLPKLNLKDGFAKSKKEHPEMMKFMGSKVKPTMARLLNRPEMSAEHPDGLGCFTCHTQPDA